MDITAKISREWRNRMLFVLVLELLFSAWFFYDGLVAYPKYNASADAYAELCAVNPDADEGTIKEKWAATAKQNNWDETELPKKRKNEAQQIHFAVGLLICSLLFGIWMLREMKRVIRATDKSFTGITCGIPPFNFLSEVQFSDVVGIDKRKWDKKGIVYIFARKKDGTLKRVTVDDYKYAGSEAIMVRCEEIIAEKKASEKKSVPAE